MGDGGYGGDKKASGSTKEFTRNLIVKCIERGIPVVLDASGIHHMVGDVFHRRDTSSPNQIVITPHPGEAAALLESRTETVQSDRFTSVRLLAERCGGVALLKGAGTLIHNGEKGCLIPLATPYLATAGSGDVLTGVVATYLSQGVDPFLAAAAAAYRHAWAGCAAARKGTGVIASDIADELGRFTVDAS
jgi:NAD(P)H-hydrate epimerase